ncbi:MAG: galactose mutarotase [Eubacteriales bacterium]|nr:galactose mutarotase [Eubacteriales bacterium]
MQISVGEFGKTADGRQVQAWRLEGDGGAVCTLLDYGGTVQQLLIPDAAGQMADVVLGYDSMEGYESADNGYHGALIGRHGNRIENAVFELGGKEYKLAANDGRNHLHGGTVGFDKKIWTARPLETEEGPSVAFSLISPDMEEGYPGNLQVTVTYTLTSDNELKLEYEAVSDQETVINLTNHSYFNLSGHQAGSIVDHLIMIEADEFTTINEECIPNGTFTSVAGTPLDLRQPTRIGDGINSDFAAIKAGQGYDHNFVIRDVDGTLKRCAQVIDTASGRTMTVSTTLPGIQFYSGNFVKEHVAKDGAVYRSRGGLCLETQFFPNSLKHKNFPSPIFKAGEKFHHITVYAFGMSK